MENELRDYQDVAFDVVAWLRAVGSVDAMKLATKIEFINYERLYGIVYYSEDPLEQMGLYDGT